MKNNIHPNPATKPGEGFLPPDYELPSSAHNYMKLQDGENKFRILARPVIGWLDWKDKKPIRYPMNGAKPQPVDPTKPVKHFWAFPVWNYNESSVQVLEITQASIQAKISNLAKDEDWGDPLQYDLKVTRSGAMLETKYDINPVPAKPLSEEIKAAFRAKPCNLEALFENGDPFDVATTPQPL